MSKKLLDLIGSVEAPNGYDTVYGNNMRKMPKPLTTMTMKEVLDCGRWRTKTFGSSACGRYQFMDATLRDLATALDLKAEDKFTPDYQDRLGLYLLRRRGFDKWMRGEMSHDAFMVNLAREWASFPVPFDMRVGGRVIKRGQSYYAGDGRNKALIGASEVWLFLRDLQAEGVSPDPTPEPPLDIDDVPDDEPDHPFWSQLEAAVKERSLPMLQAALAPIIFAALQEAVRKGVAGAVADPTVPIGQNAAPAVTARIEQIAQEEINARVAHQTNTEEDWWRKRSFWSAIVAGVIAPIAAALGHELAPSGQEQLTAGLTWVASNLVAAYLAIRAGTASKPLGR